MTTAAWRATILTPGMWLKFEVFLDPFVDGWSLILDAEVLTFAEYIQNKNHP